MTLDRNLRILDWKVLNAAEQSAALARPTQALATSVTVKARAIIERVRKEGDSALFQLTQELDRATLSSLAVTESEFDAADQQLNAEQRAAINTAIEAVNKFHAAQMPHSLRVETAPGVICERIIVPLRAVGLYVPAGSAPLPSTAIMLGVPALLAGCPIRVLCTPPSPVGHINPAILVAARKTGVKQVYKIGGAQAIAAMAYGTQSIPKCDKIFGPGNAWVTAAKILVSGDVEGAALDLPAGPSEVMIIADTNALPEFVAADLLAQAEHSEDAQALLITTSIETAEAVKAELRLQCRNLSRSAILDKSLAHVRLIVVDSLERAFEIANAYAPEHLLLQVHEPRGWLPRVQNAGAVFLGNWSPETLGDYCSGPNHTLPTSGYAKTYSGLSLEDFQKRITVQELSTLGLRALGPTAVTLAQMEGLDAHAAAVTRRLRAI